MTNTTTDAAEARATALAECAAIAERWRDENKASAAKARKSARVRGDNGMADQLEGAAIECNAIAQEIRRLATAEAASGAGEREEWSFTPDTREAKAVAQLSEEQELSPQAVMRQALRLYQSDFLRRKAGETVTWSGDAQRARDFAGPLASLPPATDPAMVLDGNDIWEALFGIMRGNVPDEMTEEVCSQLAAALAVAPTIPATGEAVVVERAAAIVERGFRCRTCDVVFVEDHADIMGGHPDNGCAAPNWDALDDIGKVAAIRALATIPATGHAATEGEGA